MTECKSITTPIEEGIIPQSMENEKQADKRHYQSLIGSLLFAALGISPDIDYAVNYLSQFMGDPAIRHEKMARKILRYLKVTIKKKLENKTTQDSSVTVYSDASYANSPQAKLYSGYLVCYGNATISWSTKKQRTVAHSTTEAELMALNEACKQGI